MTEINQRFTLDITIDQPDIAAIEWLSQHCELPKKSLKEAMTKGAVWLKKQVGHSRAKVIRRASKTLSLGNQLFCYYDNQVLAQEPPTPTNLYSGKTYSVWYKPSGMFSHGSKWGDHCAITRWVERHHQPQKPSFLVHRLDRATQGVLVIAHNKKAAAQLCQQFENHTTKKHYHAIVDGEFPPTPMRITQAIDNKNASTLAKLIQYCPERNKSLVDVTIETGRKHQIRKHLAQQGYPIHGDCLYNLGTITDSSPDIQLRAYQLSFICPEQSKERTFTINKTQFLDLTMLDLTT